MAQLIETLTGTNKNITTALAMTAFQASAAGVYLFQVRVSSMNAAAATVTASIAHQSSDGTLIGAADSVSRAKAAAANTVWGARALGPLYMVANEKCQLTLTSTNASDTAVAYSIQVLDAAWSGNALAAGAQMDLVNAPNGTAITAIQSGLATSATQTTILARLGAWTGTTTNTILGALRSLMSKAIGAPTDITSGGTYDAATDSLEAIRDTAPLGTAMRGTDGALPASSYSAPPAMITAQAVRDALKLAPTAGAADAGSVDAHLDAGALEATLTAIKGAGWTDETLKHIHDAESAASPTAAAIRAEIDANSTQLAAIVADTNELQAELANGGRTDLLIDGIAAAGVKIQAAVYDSASAVQSTGIITLSNGKTQTVSETGRVTSA